MTTVDEFNAITQQMYDRGYVMVSINDLVKKTVDDDGTVHYEEGDIYLPEGKKAFVLSLDDLSYYHSYDGRGIASKMVVGDDGKPTCEYIQDDGTVVTGAYDCIPLMDQFIEAHPDAVYHNARGTVALTGYDGILGYRTDGDYKTREDLTDDQVAWLDAHPDFDWDKECEEAKKSSRCDQSRRLDIRKPYLGPYPCRRQTDRDDPGGYREMADVCCTAHRRKRYHHLCTWTGSFRLA